GGAGVDARAAWGGTRILRKKTDSMKLDGFGRRSCRRNGCGLGKRAAAGFFFGALVDFDGALEVGAVLDHDARGGKVADDRAVFLDFNAVFRAKIALHVSIHDHFRSEERRVWKEVIT